VNLIKRLLSGRQKLKITPSSFNWPGQSGKEYQYEIHPLDTSLRPLPGIYIYAKQSEDGRWIPIYIAQTRDLHQKLEGHVNVADAIGNGATHIHVHYCSASQASRSTEERDLIHRWQPVCNELMEN